MTVLLVTRLSPVRPQHGTRPAMDIKRNGSQPSGKGPADWFTGTVRIDPL
jgi:hypothetical protein